MCMSKRKASGFTLVELIIFILVVGIGLTGILTVFHTTSRSSADPLVRKQSLAIAESMLEEILQKDFANPVGGYAGAVRALFDDVADYNGYTTAGGIVDVQGAAVPGLGNYNIAPAVVVTPLANWNGVPALQITVSVTGPGGTIVLVGFRTNN